jgi:hypothetical protein
MSCRHLIWVGDHGHVVGGDLHGGGAHAWRELPLASGGITWSPSAIRYQVGSGLPGRDAHHFPECAPVQRLLDREHDLGLDRIDVGREVVDEVVLRKPREAVLIDVEVGQGGTRGACSSSAPIDSPSSSPNPAM